MLILLPPLLFAILWVIAKTGSMFVVYLCIVMTVFILIMMVLIPICLMPMFLKFDPIEENKLKQDIVSLSKELNYPLSKIEICDGSKRSGHSNAFQYGFGKIKKIVVFDTLLDHHLGKLNGEN